MSSYCCATCHHFQAASPDELRQHVTIGWCWWLADHPGIKFEVPEWMPRGCCVNPVCWIGRGTVARRVA